MIGHSLYATISDILSDIDSELLIQLVNDENTTVDLEDDDDPAVVRINQQITTAGDEIDGYIRAHHALPLDPVPGLIRQICVDIAIYNLYKRRHRLDMPESIVNIYRDKVKLLEAIQKGVVTIGASGTPAAGESAGVRVNKTDDDRIFGRDVLDAY
ncbi:hypothetical protein ANAEL_01688 [Anaerolineales bacterium]|nr:hypothetical protein ANAEL_01688 [Anaerolineales bacterium]